jgi:site-specific DNA recombinase
MATSTPDRIKGRTLISIGPDQLVWILLARESTDRERQIGHQFADLRRYVAQVGGRIGREVTENAVSAYKRKRIHLPDGTYGYQVVRPEWENILTALRRGECNALLATDLDRAMRDPRTLEDLIDVVEYYGVHVASLTGNLDLTTDAGISSARSLVNQRNQESRNTSRRVADGHRRSAMEGGRHGTRHRPFGWRKDRIHLHKREAAHIRRELPRILAGVSALTLAREWEKRGIPTVTGAPWRVSSIEKIFLNPRICGQVVYRGEILLGEDGAKVRGKWEPILTDEEYDAVVTAWRPSERPESSRLGARGRGYRTLYLLSPFVRCGKCGARMNGARRRDRKTGEIIEAYRCPARGQGGCGGVYRDAAPVEEYITALVIAEHQKIQFATVADLPPWPKTQELADLQQRIETVQREFETGKSQISAGRHYASIARMEAAEAELLREKRRYEGQRQSRKAAVADLAGRWASPDFTMEQRQAAIAETLEAVIIHPCGRGGRFHHDQIVPVFRENHTAG